MFHMHPGVMREISKQTKYNFKSMFLKLGKTFSFQSFLSKFGHHPSVVHLHFASSFALLMPTVFNWEAIS